MRILGWTLVAAALLAGCTDVPAGESAARSDGPATGLALRENAEAAALDIDPSAQLIGLVGMEWTDAAFGEEFVADSPEAEALIQKTDESPGDGKASTWGYLFDGDDPLLVVLEGSGAVLHAEAIPHESETVASYGTGEPLGDVAIDSDEAADIVRDRNAEFASIADGEGGVVIMALAEAPGQGPFWIFTAFQGTMDDESFVLAMVNADTGAYMDFAGLAGMFG